MGGGISKAEFEKVHTEKVTLQGQLEESKRKETAALAEASEEKKKRQTEEIELGSKITTIQGRLNNALDRLAEAAKLEVSLCSKLRATFANCVGPRHPTTFAARISACLTDVKNSFVLTGTH